MTLEWHGLLTIYDLAASLGITSNEAIALRRRDSRILDGRNLRGDGLAKVRAWIAAGQPTPDFDALEYEGDPSIERVLDEVLRTVPTPVAWQAIRRCVFYGSGVESRGWIGPLLSASDDDCDYLIVLTTADAECHAHELGHFQTLPPSPRRKRRGYKARAERAAAVANLAVSVGMEAVDRHLVDPAMDRERAADAAAACWGYYPDASGCRRRDSERRRIYELAERDAPACDLAASAKEDADR